MFKKRTIASFEKLTLSLSGMRNREEYEIVRNGDMAQLNRYTIEYSGGLDNRRPELFRIEYRTAASGADVAYEIYKDVEQDNPSSGTLLEQGVHSHRYAGSHAINLNGEYPLKKGERYAVVLTVKHGDSYNEVFPYSTDFFEGMTVRGIINKGESFLHIDGKWSDMTDAKDSLRSRAPKQCAEHLATDKALPSLSLEGKVFALDNYPIKAISRTD